MGCAWGHESGVEEVVVRPFHHLWEGAAVITGCVQHAWGVAGGAHGWGCELGVNVGGVH